MLMENRLAAIISELAVCSSEDPEYQKLDEEYKKTIMKLKNQNA